MSFASQYSDFLQQYLITRKNMPTQDLQDITLGNPTTDRTNAVNSDRQ